MCCNFYSNVLSVTHVQTSGYLVRRKAWQCALLGEGWAAQAMASAHEDQERVHCLWTHWHQHSSSAGECLHHPYPSIYHNAVLKNDQSSFLHFQVLLFYFAQSPQAGTKEKTLCCWFCTSGPISLSAKIERKGYTPGNLFLFLLLLLIKWEKKASDRVSIIVNWISCCSPA